MRRPAHCAAVRAAAVSTIRAAGDTYRAVYTVRFREVVYVLHAFQKKSPKGIRTARIDIELIARRLKIAQQDYEARYGKRA